MNLRLFPRFGAFRLTLESINKKLLSHLVDFGRLMGWTGGGFDSE